MTPRSLALVLVALLALVACGEDSSKLGDAARSEIGPRVAEIRRLADGRQADQVQLELEELRVVVQELRTRGELGDGLADEVLAAAEAVSTQLPLITTTTAPPQPDDDEDEDEDEDEDKDDDGEKEGKGKGRDHDD